MRAALIGWEEMVWHEGGRGGDVVVGEGVSLSGCGGSNGGE